VLKKIDPCLLDQLVALGVSGDIVNTLPPTPHRRSFPKIKDALLTSYASTIVAVPVGRKHTRYARVRPQRLSLFAD